MIQIYPTFTYNSQWRMGIIYTTHSPLTISLYIYSSVIQFLADIQERYMILSHLNLHTNTMLREWKTSPIMNLSKDNTNNNKHNQQSNRQWAFEY